MDQIQIANILLTRRCNLRCDYCAIVRDYHDIPEEYPKMDHYKKSELKPEEWISILKRLKQNNPDVFIIFYGGEPFLYDELPQLIGFCHDENIAYTIISNNTIPVEEKIVQLFEAVGPIKGFTASIDPDLAKYKHLIDDRSTTLSHSVLKTLAGYRNLKELNESGLAEDVVAEITVMPNNHEFLLDTVKMLSDIDIWSSITVIDNKKSPYYDFSTIEDDDCKIEKTQKIYDMFMEIVARDDLKVHIPVL